MWCNAEVEAQAGKQGWATFMLPSPSEEAQYADAYPPAEPDYTALQPAALLARDEEIVSDMLAEVRDVIGTAKFHAALRVSSLAVTCDGMMLINIQKIVHVFECTVCCDVQQRSPGRIEIYMNLHRSSNRLIHC